MSPYLSIALNRSLWLFAGLLIGFGLRMVLGCPARGTWNRTSGQGR